MITRGFFGYIIGRKKRIMKFEYDANLLWQILVREIYVLFKHFGTQEELQKTIEKIKTTKNKPKIEDIENYKIFTDMDISRVNNDEWSDILHFCKFSFINMLESGYIINQKEEEGIVFLLDFNKATAILYSKDYEGKIKELNKATIEEIMEFDEMPTKNYNEIITEMKEHFTNWYDKYSKVQEEINKLKKLKQEVKKQGALNIEEKVDKLFYDMEWQKKLLNFERKTFYNRLKSLELIDESK